MRPQRIGVNSLIRPWFDSSSSSMGSLLSAGAFQPAWLARVIEARKVLPRSFRSSRGVIVASCNRADCFFEKSSWDNFHLRLTPGPLLDRSSSMLEGHLDLIPKELPKHTEFLPDAE